MLFHRGAHWRTYEKTNPELFRLALERAEEVYPEAVDLCRDTPAAIECVFGTRKVALTLQRVDSQAVNLYGWGYCTLFSLASHDLSGYPLVLFTRNQDQSQWKGHAALKIDDDAYLDITGVRTAGSIRQEYRLDVEPVTITREQFCSAVASGEHEQNPMSFVDKLEQLVTKDFAQLVLKEAGVCLYTEPAPI